MQQETQEISRLLKVAIGLLVRAMPEESISLRQQIGTLHDLGLKPYEIAQVLGRSGNYVNKELTSIRKSKKTEQV